MMLSNTFTTQKKFLFKAGSFACTVIKLLSYDLDELANSLAKEISRFPNFFVNTPIVIDLEILAKHISLDFQRLKALLETNGMRVIGIQNGSELQHEQAQKLGLAVLNARSKPANIELNIVKETMVVSQPIRSGMQVYAKQTDLIVTSQVSHGAEIMSDGNIHVYGVLRGRALAGVSGNKNSQIFCRQLEAELLAIAGYYITKEELQTLSASADITRSPNAIMQIFLQNEQIQIKPL